MAVRKLRHQGMFPPAPYIVADSRRPVIGSGGLLIRVMGQTGRTIICQREQQRHSARNHIAGSGQRIIALIGGNVVHRTPGRSA